MNNWLAIKWWLERAISGNFKHPDEDERPADPAPDAPAGDALEHVRPMVPSIGAWAGYGAYATHSKALSSAKFAQSVGLTRVDIIINDYSKHRESSEFRLYNVDKVTAFADKLNDRGIEAHLMTWCMPHERFIVQMGSALRDLASRTKIYSVMLDAEEPWTRAVRHMGYEEAAVLSEQVLAGLDWGVTGIGYASESKLGPLVEHAGYMCPQCYATSRNKLKPEIAPRQLSIRWQRMFSEKKRLVVGLPAYSQNREGYTRSDFMGAAMTSALTMKPESIVYWSLRHIRSSGTTSRIIRALSNRVTHSE